MRSQFKDCYNCAIETMQVLNKIYNQKKKDAHECHMSKLRKRADYNAFVFGH